VDDRPLRALEAAIAPDVDPDERERRCAPKRALFLGWISRRLTSLEVPADPWQVRELPLGLWRLRRRVCWALERLEGESSP
jgi:hypothetical protein